MQEEEGGGEISNEKSHFNLLFLQCFKLTLIYEKVCNSSFTLLGFSGKRNELRRLFKTAFITILDCIRWTVSYMSTDAQ